MQCLPYLQDQVQLPLRAQHSVSLLKLLHHSLPGIWSTPLITNPTPGPAGYQLDFGRHKVLSFFFVRGYSFTWNVFTALCFLFLFPTCPSRSSWNVTHFRSLPSPPTGHPPGTFFLAEPTSPSAVPTGLPFCRNCDRVPGTAPHSYPTVSVQSMNNRTLQPTPPLSRGLCSKNGISKRKQQKSRFGGWGTVQRNKFVGFSSSQMVSEMNTLYHLHCTPRAAMRQVSFLQQRSAGFLPPSGKEWAALWCVYLLRPIVCFTVKLGYGEPGIGHNSKDLNLCLPSYTCYAPLPPPPPPRSKGLQSSQLFLVCERGSIWTTLIKWQWHGCGWW